MIILQTASGDISLTFEGTRLLGETSFSSAPATTFRDNTYIHRLNRTLQSEMRAISAYASVQSFQTQYLAANPSIDLEQSIVDHQQAGRELVRLIILNRGIPEDRAALSFGLTGTFLQFCSRVPSRLFARATLSTLSQLERHLCQNYERLLQEAPARDREPLSCLRDAAKKHLADLK